MHSTFLCRRSELCPWTLCKSGETGPGEDATQTSSFHEAPVAAAATAVSWLQRPFCLLSEPSFPGGGRGRLFSHPQARGQTGRWRPGPAYGSLAGFPAPAPLRASFAARPGCGSDGRARRDAGAAGEWSRKPGLASARLWSGRAVDLWRSCGCCLDASRERFLHWRPAGFSPALFSWAPI